MRQTGRQGTVTTQTIWQSKRETERQARSRADTDFLVVWQTDRLIFLEAHRQAGRGLNRYRLSGC